MDVTVLSRSLMQMLAGSGACSRAVVSCTSPAAIAHCMALWCHHLSMASAIFYLQLSAMDVSVRTTMKGAAKCDKHCELQNSVNRQGLERILCFWEIPESMPPSVFMLYCSSNCRSLRACCCECLCIKMCGPLCFHTFEASNSQGSVATANFLSTFGVRLIVLVAGWALLSIALASPSFQNMKLGWQTR